MSFIKTFTGHSFDIMAITADDLNIEDIATALSRLCRWGGHTASFYSVAEHSVHVSMALPQDLKLAGLLHDASEAYVQDMIGPLKNQDFMAGYRSFENYVQKLVEQRFAVDLNHPAVLEADRVIGYLEGQQLMKPLKTGHLVQFKCWVPGEAKSEFLKAFHNLFQGD